MRFYMLKMLRNNFIAFSELFHSWREYAVMHIYDFPTQHDTIKNELWHRNKRSTRERNQKVAIYSIWTPIQTYSKIR
jgi:hypothetical protein